MELKFKAWDKKNKVMTNVAVIEFTDPVEERLGIWVYISDPRKVYWLDKFLDEYQLLQYTGVKDKNEIEIYRGHIIARTTIPDRVVSYKAPMFVTRKINTNYEALLSTDEFDVVVGNIFENPELLLNTNYHE